MEKSWIKIYTSTNNFQASLVSSVLKDHQIDVVEINKKDSEKTLNFEFSPQLKPMMKKEFLSISSRKPENKKAG